MLAIVWQSTSKKLAGTANHCAAGACEMLTGRMHVGWYLMDGDVLKWRVKVARVTNDQTWETRLHPSPTWPAHGMPDIRAKRCKPNAMDPFFRLFFTVDMCQSATWPMRPLM